MERLTEYLNKYGLLSEDIKVYRHETYHILKQHELELTKVSLRIPNLDRKERLMYLCDQLPETKDQMTVRQLCSLLGYTDDRQYYKALDYYHNLRS
ncbi:hypothetical protein [Sphingobacterium tabacisoli]|uniref:Uncharacterized protein n=1 Tax=Sphingobacterium tabacisoli TaxID=2044855 RepID=A0ABW5L037_9SPHI|nr:hypothetical protein [Sphingobacterium tabacisoli]